jgi:NAD(P)H dehydrogenase (quinone)
MTVLGIPYTQPDLMTTSTGGTPYGASHWSGVSGTNAISNESRTLAIALGQRLAHTALKLKAA